MTDHVLDHHHRAVHNHAEIERAKRKQVRGNVHQVEADGRKQQREGNGERDDDGAAHVAQKQKQNDGNKNHAGGQIVLNGFDRELDEIGAIEKRNHLHALGQDSVVELLTSS